MVDGSRLFSKGRNQNQMSPEDIEAILTACQTVGTNDAALAKVIDHAEIKENGWDLNMGRYLKPEAAEILDVGSALAALRNAQARLRDAEEKLNTKLGAAGYA